jgi:hypothetical protein
VGFVLSFAALVACGVAFVITRYGNERQDAFSSQDIASVHYLYAHAKPRAAVFAAYDNVPWRYRHYADFRYGILHGELVEGQNVPGIVAQMRRAHRPDVYLILTRSEEEGGHLFQGWSADLVPRLRRHVLASPQFRLLFSRPDSAIFQLRSRAEIDARDRDARAFALAELRRAHRLGLYNGPIGSNPDPQATYRSLSSRLWHRKHRRSR